MRRLIAGLVGLLAFGPAALAGPRIVSMNLCADELVLRLADRDQVASVSFLSGDRHISNVADLAEGLPVNHGLAEEVVTAAPDLVVAGRHTTRNTVALLRKLDFPVLELDVPASFAAVEAQIREVAAVVGHPERGEAMIDGIRAGLDAIPRRGDRARALVLRPNGLTAGAGTLVDTLLGRAGLVNLGTSPGLEGYTGLPLEWVVTLRPDILIVDSEPYPAPARAADVLHHPILGKLPFEMRVIGVPNRLWTCAGPAMVEAVAILVEARDGPAFAAADRRP
ncbi:ABC transporter substrate-binding protein [Zavarzinia compransoris]|uniref:ABC transporter substrate-binding protein n=1 Tax=Zavarzinia marina TaxID=2911065 RepID=UPI001F169752|nr:ABC transporter substrate-binding protein [Zavarzinia marina]MCF4167395.1 ABC transporter substrate-binding protein [Zavarzinia marina]